MSTSIPHWDPATLFDLPGPVAIDNNWPGGIQCIGVAESHGNRCGWVKKGHGDDRQDVREAFALLDELERTPPGDVRAADLHVLAQLCLCRKLHQGQAGGFARDWVGLVKAAAAVGASARDEGEVAAGYTGMMMAGREVVQSAVSSSSLSWQDSGYSGSSSARPLSQWQSQVQVQVRLQHQEEERRGAGPADSELYRPNAELRPVREDFEELRSQVNEMVRSLQEKLEKATAEKEVLSGQVRDRSDEIRTLREDLALARQNNQGLVQQNKVLEGRLGLIEQQLDKSQELFEQRDADLKEAKKNEARTIREKDGQIESVKELLRQEEEKVKNSITEASRLKVDNSLLTKQVKNLEADLHSLRVRENSEATLVQPSESGKDGLDRRKTRWIGRLKRLFKRA
ncbi:hypothetical protein QBC43DRAFT_361380 [Cladorrhinum sp. PSN259]|nr:hypothetical protein QBC43DRAFT_361380 [Cladorrhinum sp. PSN259]